jgi:two-component system response regulator AtoC
LIRFNCAALTESLAEAELFGHERGAFTGAVQRREGFFQRADGGTLVLDEVAELPPTVQGKLLRALQHGEVQRVGAPSIEHVDVRVVACTAAPLEAKVSAGEFRSDLYYRLAVVKLVVPPLRERREDIPRLVRHFQLKHRERFELNDVPLPDEWIESLSSLAWPGNVRELENVVAELLAFSDDGYVPAEAFRRVLDSRRSDAGVISPRPSDDTDGSLRQRVEHFERALIERALQDASGNQSEAARALGTTRTTLLDKMKRLGLRGRA